MPEYRLSQRADADIIEIATYTIKHFGIVQARRYRDGLERVFQTLLLDCLLYTSDAADE